MTMEAIPRFGSIHDGRDSASHTDVSDVVADLARLHEFMSVPRVLAASECPRALDSAESWMFSIVQLGMCVQGILDMSPLEEDETLRILARLVGLRVVTLDPPRRAAS
jgi:hypothetical protein